MKPVVSMLLPAEEMGARILWLIRMRWIAAASLIAAIAAAGFVLRFRLALPELLGGAGLLVGLNLLYRLTSIRWARSHLLIHLQISLDLLLLAYLLYFSGGVRNPFVIFFVFHMSIAGILLPPRQAYFQAVFALILFSLLAAGELTERIVPRPFFQNIQPLADCSRAFQISLFLSFTASLFGIVYLTATIAAALRRREGDLEEAIRSLEGKDREKSRYVRTVSHDIKGSISAIQSCLRVVLDGLTGPVPEQARRMVERAERRSVFLLRFANELLYLSLLRTGEGFAKTEVPLSQLVSDAVREKQPAATERGVQLDLVDNTAGIRLRADAEAIRRLILELLANAVQYSPRKGRVEVRIEGGLSEREVRISVLDNGSGISEEDMPHIFNDFYCGAPPAGGELPRTGMGLAIAKLIAELHGGGIRAHSICGKGSTFVVTIPA